MTSELCFPFVLGLLIFSECFKNVHLIFGPLPRSSRAVIWGTADDDPCSRVSAVLSQRLILASGDTKCLSTLEHFRKLPAQEQSSCINAQEPAICRPNLEPDPHVYKCSFVCDTLQPLNQWSSVSSDRWVPKRKSQIRNSGRTYKSIQEIKRTVKRPSGHSPPPTPYYQRPPTPSEAGPSSRPRWGGDPGAGPSRRWDDAGAGPSRRRDDVEAGPSSSRRWDHPGAGPSRPRDGTLRIHG